MADPLSTLLQKKKEQEVSKPAAPKAFAGVAATSKASSFGDADVGSALGRRSPGGGLGDGSSSLFGDQGITVGERIYNALAPGSTVDFPMVTDICESVAGDSRQAAEAVRLLHSAFAGAQGPPRRKLKALTIMHELMHDRNAAEQLQEVHGARESLWQLQRTHNTGLGESADEQIRMFATEIERTCFGTTGDPFTPVGAAQEAASKALAADPTLPSDPFAPIGVPNLGGSLDAFTPPARNFAPDFTEAQKPRKREQAANIFGNLGAVVGDKLAQAQNLLTATQTQHETVPRLEPLAEGNRPVLSIEFDALLAGEIVHYAFKNAHLHTANPFYETPGRLLITNYRLKFQVPKGTLHEKLTYLLEKAVLDVPLGTIEELKAETSTSEAGAQEFRLRIKTKDFRHLTFLLSTIQELQIIQEAVTTMSQPGEYGTSSLFAFKYAKSSWERGLTRSMAGWELYDPFAEFARQGVETPHSPNAESPWVLCDANHKYALCDTYPAWLAQPRSVSNSILMAAAAFRKRGRLPTMSWCAGRAGGFASLWRSSQPTEGLLGNGCPEDERLVRTIREGSKGCARPLLVMDLRPYKSAYANKVGGGGFENYDGCRLVFGGIDNVHVVRDGWKNMGKAVAAQTANEVGSWFKDVAKSGWYDLVGSILQCAGSVVNEMRAQASVLIHCSDGWDRTAQVASLAMLCMDPYYRTVRGFLLLIEKEFCSFGHRFRTRLGNGEKPSSEYSPVFLQWLECVYHATEQYPTAFEFTPALLLRIGADALSNQYGTFLTDSERERNREVTPNTLSLWSAILDAGPAPEHTNPRYQPLEEPLLLSPCQVNLKVWEEYWFRFVEHPRDQLRRR